MLNCMYTKLSRFAHSALIQSLHMQSLKAHCTSVPCRMSVVIAAWQRVQPHLDVLCCRPSSAGAASAGIATACRLNCLSILTVLSRLKPDEVANSLIPLLEETTNALPAPPEELMQQLLHSLCTLVAAPGGHQHIRPAVAALAGEGNSLLASGRYERANLLFVLEELTTLAKAYLAQHGTWSAAQGLKLCSCYVYCKWLTVNLDVACCRMVLHGTYYNFHTLLHASTSSSVVGDITALTCVCFLISVHWCFWST